MHKKKATFASQERYWDSVAETKEFPTPFQMGLFKEHVATHMRILDVGCGYGRTLNELYQNGFMNCTGIDFSQGMIDRGSRIHPHLHLMKNETSTLPFQDNSFDAVLLIAVLTCIAGTGDQEALVSEIVRVLKDGGIIYINDYLVNSDERNVRRYEEFSAVHGEYGIFELPEGAVLRHHTREHITRLLKDFTTLAYEGVTYTTMNGNTSKGFYYLGKKR